MATTKKCVIKSGSRVTAKKVRADLKSLGYRMPKGYAVVKRTSKPTVKRKTSKK